MPVFNAKYEIKYIKLFSEELLYYIGTKIA
jgi:hypothetical protein